jgi:hypothetical protein
MAEMNDINQHRDEDSASVEVLKVLVKQATDLAKEAKTIAISAKTHVCAKESELIHLQQAIDESKEAMGKISDTNLQVVEELGKWKWFRMLITPLAILIFTTATGAFASFVYVKNDVEETKRHQKATVQEMKAVRDTQRTLMDTVKKREKETRQNEKNMKTIVDKLEEISENTKAVGNTRKRR